MSTVSPANPLPSNIRYRLPIVATVVVGIILSVVLFSLVRQAEEAREEAEVKQAANRAAQDIQRSIDLHLETLESIRAFYAASESVERDEFALFTADGFGRCSGFDAFLWIPRVAEGNLGTFAATTREEPGMEGFKIIPAYGPPPVALRWKTISLFITSRPRVLPPISWDSISVRIQKFLMR